MVNLVGSATLRYMNKRTVIDYASPILWMLVIFVFSHQPAAISDTQSGVFVEQLQTWFPAVDSGFLTFIVRKSAHIFAYFVLGVLMFRALRRTNLARPVLWAVTICAIYAATDEFHQLFVPGRSGEVRDILIDTVAALLGTVVSGVYYRYAEERIGDKHCRK